MHTAHTDRVTSTRAGILIRLIQFQFFIVNNSFVIRTDGGGGGREEESGRASGSRSDTARIAAMRQRNIGVGD